MNIIRFADLCAKGKAQAQRVFIRADLNVPFDDHGHISEDTRIRASVPCIQMALAAGAAVMVSHGAFITTWQDARLYGAAAGVAYYLSRRGQGQAVLGTIVVGMAVYLPLHMGWGW